MPSRHHRPEVGGGALGGGVSRQGPAPTAEWAKSLMPAAKHQASSKAEGEAEGERAGYKSWQGKRAGERQAQDAGVAQGAPAYGTYEGHPVTVPPPGAWTGETYVSEPTIGAGAPPAGAGVGAGV